MAASIHQLKVDAYKATTEEKYAYQSPDGKMFRKKRPGKSLIDAGWKFTKVKFQRVESCMSPRHPRWHDYRNAKRRATLLLAARLILKANDLNVPGSGAVSKTDVKADFESRAPHQLFPEREGGPGEKAAGYETECVEQPVRHGHRGDVDNQGFGGETVGVKTREHHRRTARQRRDE